MTRHEEKHWVTEAQKDPYHFSVLYQEYIDEIYRFIYYKTSAKEVAEDLTSQVFMHALEHLNQFQYRPGARFSSWLYTIARHQVIDYYRKNHPTVNLEDVDPVAASETASVHVDQQLHKQRVHDILQQLPPSDKEVLQLRLWQEKSYSEIAQIIGANAVAVRARYSRAIKKFTKLYTERYGTTS